MKTNIHIYIFAFMALLAFNLHAQTNMVTNGGFETLGEDGKPTGWTYAGSSVTYSTVTDNKQEGEKALKALVSSTSSAARTVTQSVSGIEAGAKYDFSFWYNVIQEPSNADGGIKYNLGWINASGDVILAGDGVDEIILLTYASSTWLPVSRTELTAPTGAVGLYIRIAFNRQVGALIDDVKLIKTTTTGLNESPVSLLVRKQGNDLIVTTQSGSNVEVYNTLGLKLQSQIANSSETTLSNLPKGQVLIVRSGTAVAKVIL